MARVKDILNQWGRQGGPNPQRSDLWQVDLSAVIAGLNDTPGLQPYLPEIPRYFSASITLPELKIKADTFKKDSRSYMTPGADEPLDAIKMTFIVDDGGKQVNSAAQASQSTIYTVMDLWRAVVRAGRGPMGSETSLVLGPNYRLDYAWPVYVYLLKGQTLPATFANVPVRSGKPPSMTLSDTFGDSGFLSEHDVTATQVISQNQFSDLYPQQAALEVAAVYRLENTWLAGFKLGDLAYDRSQVLTLDATFYADNILQDRRAENVPSFL